MKVFQIHVVMEFLMQVKNVKLVFLDVETIVNAKKVMSLQLLQLGTASKLLTMFSQDPIIENKVMN